MITIEQEWNTYQWIPWIWSCIHTGCWQKFILLIINNVPLHLVGDSFKYLLNRIFIISFKQVLAWMLCRKSVWYIRGRKKSLVDGISVLGNNEIFIANSDLHFCENTINVKPCSILSNKCIESAQRFVKYDNDYNDFNQLISN